MIDREDDRYCPILKQTIPEIECYETVLGCMDSMVFRKTYMSYEQIRKTCANCPYSDLS